MNREAQFQMPYKSISIKGLRGFETSQTLNFAIPNDTNEGSGLTIVVGENNSGKSTVIEAIRCFSLRTISGGNLNFPEGRRNKRAGDKVEITLTDDQDNSRTLQTISQGGSEVEFTPQNVQGDFFPFILTLPSRRYFQTYFNESSATRENYAGNIAVNHVRGGLIGLFPGRLLAIARGTSAGYEAVLRKLVDPIPTWVIDRTDQQAWYVKFLCANGQSHASEGAGEGLISLLCIADALYDSNPGDLIAIDEPELSLHPSVLRRVNQTLGEYNRDRQIVVATHSPYFADMRFVCNGAVISRVYADSGGSKIGEVTRSTATRLRGLLNNKNNPHIFGLDSREIFFQKDSVILVEGQEDVMFYPDVAQQLGLAFDGNFFGWGAGGADNMPILASLLHDLKFSRVVGILDANRRDRIQALSDQFPDYLFLAISADDVRTKEEKKPTPEIKGLLIDGALRPEYANGMRTIIKSLNEYLARN